MANGNGTTTTKADLQDQIDSAIGVLDDAYQPEVTREDLAEAVGNALESSTPTGEVTVFDAIDKQLGIKLQKQKHPMPVMVIDHVERPGEN